MAAGPVGFVLGGLVDRPAGRARPCGDRLIRPFAVLAPLVLVPALVDAAACRSWRCWPLLSGFAQGGLMPTLNAQFVLALPHGYRARAFGVMQSGVQVSQGGAVLLTGAAGQPSSLPLVVGLWSVAGRGADGAARGPLAERPAGRRRRSPRRAVARRRRAAPQRASHRTAAERRGWQDGRVTRTW